MPTAPPFWCSPGVKSLVLGDLPLLSEPSLWCEGISPTTHLSRAPLPECSAECVWMCVYSRGGGHFLGSESNTNYSAIWWSAPSQLSLTLLSEETCCAQCHGFALWHMSFICTSTHARTHQFMCTRVCVCNRWEWQGIVRGGSAEMCFPARSLYPPVLTPLGDRPPGNKSRLSDTLHPCSATTTTTTTTHTPSQQSTKK